jgi:elongation factor G
MPTSASRRWPIARRIRDKIEVEGKFVRQSGGRGQYGHVLDRDSSPTSAARATNSSNGIVGGTVPKEFIPAVDKGISEAIERGVLAGYPVVDVKVTAVRRLVPRCRFERDGVQDRRPRWASRTVAAKRAPVLLEPIMKVEVVTPEEYSGDVIGDLNRRRGQITRHGRAPNGKVVDCRSAARRNVRLRHGPCAR